jgi:hypothetical protein
MTNLKQSTLNQHVNLEAIGHYADSLRERRERLDARLFEDERGERERSIFDALQYAETAMRLAITLAQHAQYLDDRYQYDHMYGHH